MNSPSRLEQAYLTARQSLLEQRCEAGRWEGELASSALSTATAASALSLYMRHTRQVDDAPMLIVRLIHGAVGYIVNQQNADGGWGDTDKSRSNIATTMLCAAALHLTEEAKSQADVLSRADAYIERCGGLDALRRRYGKDKTFAVPILTNCALAGRADWSAISPLPFEMACLPQSWYRFVGLPVVSYAIPALVAIGQARFMHKKPLNPLMRIVRSAAIGSSLRVLRRMQPASGGYLEATPLTSFVVMSLAATGRADHEVTRSGVRFLIDSARPDGSWPIDSNLATWNTTLAINALAADNAVQDEAASDSNEVNSGDEAASQLSGLNDVDPACIDWVLACQHRQRHPFTGADPGGWGWTDLSGAVPDADDTTGALLALAHWRHDSHCSAEQQSRIDEAADEGVDWLLKIQNSDGGWPTFCRGWGKLPFDRSGADLTAHALRALSAWPRGAKQNRIERATRRGLKYLASRQREDGSWTPLWFGNQHQEDEENPVYGTAKVLLAYDALEMLETNPALRGLNWLVAAQNGDGGWGGDGSASSVEETALAVEALSGASSNANTQTAWEQGVQWLIEAVESGKAAESSPIGFYFAKLWYYERLYPLIFTVAALGRAAKKTASALDTLSRAGATGGLPASDKTRADKPPSDTPSRHA